jgi:predicted nucleotidyltransferase
MLASDAYADHTEGMAPSPQSLGGRARARRLSSDERRRIARRAAHARWNKTDPRKVLDDRALMEDFCRRHGLRALYAFGSIVTSSFHETSDVDLLYVPEKPLGYAAYCDAVDELRTLFGRPVDFINREVIERSANVARRRAILSTAKALHEAV